MRAVGSLKDLLLPGSGQQEVVEGWERCSRVFGLRGLVPLGLQ